MPELTEIIGDYNTFLGDIIGRIEDEGFDLNDFSQMDHMCYRTESIDEYEQKKRELSRVAMLLTETNVNGRPICTFRLNVPVTYDKWRIDAIELPAPKPGKMYESGLEHVELVMFDDIEVFLDKYEDKEFDLRAVDRGVNPEIGYQLGEYQVKFHLLSLTTVTYLENKLGITEVKDGE